jgi:hypothetical protein
MKLSSSIYPGHEATARLGQVMASARFGRPTGA